MGSRDVDECDASQPSKPPGLGALGGGGRERTQKEPALTGTVTASYPMGAASSQRREPGRNDRVRCTFDETLSNASGGLLAPNPPTPNNNLRERKDKKKKKKELLKPP